MLKIGYQGICGSYSEQAAKKLLRNIGLYETELVPLVSSEKVVSELKCGGIDYGVVAVVNSIGGTVEETKTALDNFSYSKISAVSIDIHQCLFKKNSKIYNSGINKIVSHIQALKQTENNLRGMFPYAKMIEAEDTAIAAKKLSENVYDDYTAVVCSAAAGEIYHLSLIRENIEDMDNNRTMFYLISKAE